MLGRAFCLAAMIKCGKGTETEHLVILVELFKILKSKDYLRQDRIHGFFITKTFHRQGIPVLGKLIL